MKTASALAALLCVAFTAAANAADPHAGYFYPAGIQAGTTNRILVGGQNMWRLRGMHFGTKGLRVLDIEPVPGFPNPTGMQMRHLRNWLDGIAKGNREEPEKPDDPHMSEWRSNSWWRVLGTLDRFELSIVERNLFTPRNALQDAPSLRQLCIVTVAADADAKPGIYGASIWNDGGISAPRPFAVTAAPHAAEPLYVPPHRPQPEAPVVDATLDDVVLDGQIMPGETDAFRLRLSGGRRYYVKVTARELQPYVGDAVPGFFNPAVVIRDSQGRVVAKADDAARFRPDPSFDFKPYSPDVYTLEIRDVLYRGRADFVYSVEIKPCRTGTGTGEAKVKPFSSSRLPDGSFAFAGTVSRPGVKQLCEFTVHTPGRRVFETRARRDGSPLDAVLTLVKMPGKKQLAHWDDVTNRVFVGTVPQGEADPVGEFDFAEAGRYAVEISDRTGHGGEDYFWSLEVRSPKPDFEVYSARSTLPLYRGRPLKVDFAIVRKEGFDGSVTLEFPKDVRARGNVATSGVERITVELTYVGRSPVELRDVKVSARGRIDGAMVRRDAVPCDEYEQAFAWKHFVPAESFVMRATPGNPPPRGKGRKTGRPAPRKRQPK